MCHQWPECTDGHTTLDSAAKKYNLSSSTSQCAPVGHQLFSTTATVSVFRIVAVLNFDIDTVILLSNEKWKLCLFSSNLKSVLLMYVSPNLSQQIQNRKIELHAELKLCPFIRFKRVLCNLRAVSATLLHSARYSDSGETCSHAVFVRTPAQPSCAPLRRSLVRNGRM